MWSLRNRKVHGRAFCFRYKLAYKSDLKLSIGYSISSSCFANRFRINLLYFNDERYLKHNEIEILYEGTLQGA